MTVANVAPSIGISGAANVNEGSSYSLTLGSVTDPGTDTVISYIVHWGDGSDRHLRRRNGVQDATPTPTARPTRASPSTWSTRTAPTSTAPTRFSVDGRQRGARRIAISGAANVNEGSPYSLTLGSRHRPGHRHAQQLHRALGRRRHRHLRHATAPRPRPTLDGPDTPTPSPSTWSTRTARSLDARRAPVSVHGRQRGARASASSGSQRPT